MINKRRSLLINSAKALATVPLLSNTAIANNWSRLSDMTCQPPMSHNLGWVAGGTKSMRAPFPPFNVPFSEDSCEVTQDAGVGPCYFDNVTTAHDISEGQQGVPMALAFKLVNENCEPVEEGALVEVWWANNEGVYSADTSDSTNGTTDDMFTGATDIEIEGGVPPFYAKTCALLVGGNNDEALDTKWFRGKQLTDADGCVYFKGCFPGWYTGRSAHIHFRVTRLGGETYATQLGYDAEVARDIYLNHPDYTGKDQDMSNDKDPWFSVMTSSANFIDTLRQRDGSMLAYKTLRVV